MATCLMHAAGCHWGVTTPGPDPRLGSYHVALESQPVAWRKASGLGRPPRGAPILLRGKPLLARSTGGRRAAALRPLAAGGGFGQKAAAKAKPKQESIDFRRVTSVDTYKLFVRKSGEMWGPLGEVLVEEGADVAQALRERRKTLLAAVHHQYPLFLRPKMEEVEFGIFKDESAPKAVQPAAASNSPPPRMEVPADGIVLTDLGGKLEEGAAMAATLRVDDGIAKAPKYKR